MQGDSDAGVSVLANAIVTASNARQALSVGQAIAQALVCRNTAQIDASVWAIVQVFVSRGCGAVAQALAGELCGLIIFTLTCVLHVSHSNALCSPYKMLLAGS